MPTYMMVNNSYNSSVFHLNDAGYLVIGIILITIFVIMGVDAFRKKN